MLFVCDTDFSFFIYNSRRTVAILLKFSGRKRSNMENIAAKFRRPEVVAMETVIDSLFFLNDRYLSRRLIYCLEILAICSPKA